MAEVGKPFGSCCVGLKDALEGGDFEPLITVESNEIIYMTVGLVNRQETEPPTILDHPLFFCPFCGTKLQTPEEVEAKAGANGEEQPPQA
jgi:hypothetical protein